MAGEPALIYDVTEHRTHHEHMVEALDFAQRADSFERMAHETKGAPSADQRMKYLMLAASNRDRAQLHATMAVYEALVLPGYGTIVGDEAERRRGQ